MFIAVYPEENPLISIKNHKKCQNMLFEMSFPQLHTQDLPIFVFFTSTLVLQVSRIGSAPQLQTTGHAQAEETYVQRTVSLQALTVIFV